MTVREQLRDDLKATMRSGDTTRRMVIREVLAAIKETEQRNREELVRQALKKHNISRPAPSDEAAVAAYEQTVSDVIAREDVEAASQLDDDGVLAVIQKLVKQRHDSIADAERAGRSDLVEAWQGELAHLEGYLPRQLGRDEIAEAARAVIAEVGADSPRDMGRVMGVLMERLKGQADGKLISQVVRDELAG